MGYNDKKFFWGREIIVNTFGQIYFKKGLIPKPTNQFYKFVMPGKFAEVTGNGMKSKSRRKTVDGDI